jgi:hypothetical protein
MFEPIGRQEQGVFVNFQASPARKGARRAEDVLKPGLFISAARRRQQQQHGSRIEHQDRQRRDQPHRGFSVARPEQRGEVERRASLVGYAGALRLDVGLLHRAGR